MDAFKWRWIESASYAILIALFYSIAASQAIQSFSYKWTTIAVHKQYSLDKVFEGTAPKPYAYRILIPSVINGVIDYAPDHWLLPILKRSKNTLSATIGIESEKINDKIATSYGLTLLLDFFLLVFTLFTLRELTKKILSIGGALNKLIADVAPILFALMLSISYRVYNGFVYDHFELFALSAYVLFSWEKRWGPSIFILALAILNKETAIFFPLFGLAISYARNQDYQPKNDGWKFLAEFVVVIVGFVFVRYLLRNHPGGSVEWHAIGNLDFWLSTTPLSAMTTPHLQVIPLPKPTNIIIFLPIFYSIFGFWIKKPSVVKITLLLSACINLPLFFIFSYRDEFRNLSLMFPFLYLATTHTVLEHYKNIHDGNVT